MHQGSLRRFRRKEEIQEERVGRRGPSVRHVCGEVCSSSRFKSRTARTVGHVTATSFDKKPLFMCKVLAFSLAFWCLLHNLNVLDKVKDGYVNIVERCGGIRHDAKLAQ